MLAHNDNKLFNKPEVSVPQLAWVATLFWLLSANAPFLTTALQGRTWDAADTWRFAAALAGGVAALHLLLLSLVAHPRLIKPAVMLLSIVAAAAHFYSQRFNLYLDPSMVPSFCTCCCLRGCRPCCCGACGCATPGGRRP
jgi:lipid A ethanolaminephosphotransferase